MAAQDSDKIATDILARLQTQRGVLRGAQALRAATSNPTVVGSADSQIREAQRSISYLEEQLRTLQSRRSSSGATPPSGSGPGRVASPGLQGRPDGPPGSFTSTSSQTSLAGRSYFGDSSASYASSGTSAAPGGRDDRPLPPPPPGGGYDSSNDNLSAGGYGQGGWQPAPIGRMGTSARKNFTNLDLIKYDAPHSTAQISRMLHQLEFKLQIEKQYKMGIDKMAKLYSAEGDRKSKSDAESKRVESASKIVLLQHSLRKYQQLHVIDDAEEDAMPGSLEDRRQKLRKPLSGTLQISVRSARDIEHTPIPRGTRSGRESTVVIKIEDSPRARTHPSRSDRWSEDFEIAADNANEIEVTVYDRIGSAHPVPVGMLWIRISDIVEELRKKKFGQVDGGGLNAAGGGGGWVPAEDVRGQGFSGLGPNGGGDLSYHQTPAGAPASIDPAAEGVEAWFAVEPAGAIALRLNFIKQNVRKHAFDARLGRQGAVRKRKEDVAEINGHKFVSRQFYQIIRCALCGEFLLNAAGSQCEDCRYTCHKKCAQKVVTKCISKSNAEAERDEVKINHRIPHRFEPITNLSANWCCHCGYILPLGRKGARKCSDCDVTCHSDCAHLVPDFCGMSMAMANQLLSDMETIKRVKDSAKTQAIPEGRPAPGTYSGGGYGAVPPVSRIPPPVSGYGNAGPIQQHPDPRLTGLESQTQDMSIRPQEGYMGPPPVHQQQMHPHMQQQQQQSQPQPGYPQRLPQSQAGPQSMPVKPQGGMDMVPPRPLPQQPLTQGPSRPDLPGPGPHSRIGSSASQGSLGSAAAAGQAMQVQQQQQQQQQQALAQQPPRNPPSSKRKVDLNCFNFLAVLGKGNFGKVMLAEEKRTGNLYAIKVLKKEFIIENDEVESTKSEKRVFLAAARERHPFLLGLHSCFQTETRVYFVMEYVSGGDLMLHIQRKQFTPRRAKFYAAEVLLALEYFHKQGIIYRDLKLDNILLTLDGHVKVADYGLCKEEMWYGNTTSTFCGTPEFMAPEILLEQRYGRAVDWWAFGILIYEMLLGQAPFRGDDEDEIFDAILEDEPLYPISMPRDSVSILQKLLARDPTRRLGSGPNDADDIKAHPFFRDVNWDDMFHKRVPPPFCPTLKSPTDTTWFDTEFTNEKPTLTPVHSVLSAQDQAEFKSFSWTAPNL